MDANTYHTNRMLENQQLQAESLERLIEHLEDEFLTIDTAKESILKVAKDFEGCDFSEEIINEIKGNL